MASDLTYFTGDTVNEQAESIANALSGNATIAPDFDVTVDGSKVTITSKYEGTKKTDGTTDAPSVKSIKVTDKGTKKDTANCGETTPGATDGTGGKASFLKLFDTATAATPSTPSMDVGAGDTLTFEFTINSKTYKAKLDVTDAMITDTTAGTTSNIAEALKNVKLEDQADTTGSDESRLRNR